MEIVLRIVIIYLFLLVGLRVLGKREFGQMSPLELVTLLLIPQVVAQALVGDDRSLTTAIVGVATLLVLVFVNSLLTQRFKKLETLVSGEPTVLVRHGQLLPDAMNLMRVSAEEVFTEMHKSGIERLEQVQWAILESDGQIAIVPVQDSDMRGAALRANTMESKMV